MLHWIYILIRLSQHLIFICFNYSAQWSRESIHLNKYRETQREQIKEPQMCLCCLSLTQNKHQLEDFWVPWVSSVGREGSTQKIKPSSYIVFFLPVAAVFVDSIPLSTNSLSFHQLLQSLNFPLHIQIRVQIRVQHWIYQTWAKICLMITLLYLFGLFLSIFSPLLFLPSLFLLNLMGSICPLITSVY